MNRLASVLLGTIAACSKASGLPYYRTPHLVPEWLSEREASAPTMHRVGAFALFDQNGARVTDAALQGRVTIAHFFFTRCRDVCPLTTHALAGVLDSLPQDARVQILSYSVTPERDSVAVLEQFAGDHQISDSRWHLLTGDVTATARLARQSYFVSLGDGRNWGVDSIAHTESLVLVDGQGRLRGVYAGTLPLDVQRLLEDTRVLLEASPSR